MAVYSILAALLVIGCILERDVHLGIKGKVLAVKKSYSPIYIYYILCCCVMLAIVALRGDFWTDSYGYSTIFYRTASTPFTEVLKGNSLLTNGDELLFSILTKIISYFTDEFAVYCVILATMTYVPIFFVIAKKSDSPHLSLLIVFTLGFFFSSFNVVRSCLAYGLATVMVDSIRDCKTIKVVLAAIVLSGIHSSALLFIPIYFLLQVPLLDRKHIIITFSGMCLFWVLFGEIFKLVDRFLVKGFYSTGYSGLGIQSGVIGLARPAIFVLGLILLMNGSIDWQNPEEKILVNGTLVWCAMGITVLQMRLMTRFSDMMFIYPTLLIPRLLFRVDLRISGKEISKTLIFLGAALLLVYRITRILGDSPFNPYISCLGR